MSLYLLIVMSIRRAALVLLVVARYGIRNIRVVASSARAVVQDCVEAEGSPDARDKFFM